MSNINVGRLVLAGLLTGVVWGVLYAAALPLVERHDIPSVLPVQMGDEPASGAMHAIVLVMPFVSGIATMWLYAVIRPRFGPGPKTAVVAGLAIWLYGSWLDATWEAFKSVPLRALVGPVAINLPIVLVSAIAGAWLYKE